MNRRNFISVMALAATLKFTAPDDGIALYSTSHPGDDLNMDDWKYVCDPFGDVTFEWIGDGEEPIPDDTSLSEASLEQILIEIDENNKPGSLLLPGPYRTLRWA